MNNYNITTIIIITLTNHDEDDPENIILVIDVWLAILNLKDAKQLKKSWMKN